MIYAFGSEQGRRTQNEDSIFAPRRGEISFVAVADGMGGHNAGGMASSMAIEQTVGELKKGGAYSPEALLKNAVSKANDSIFELSLSSREYRGMGTTFVGALLFRSRYVAANVGDSRLYHFDGYEAVQVTHDHSYVAELVAAGQITPEQALNHPRKNIITRAVGTRRTENIDIYEMEWETGDILMLCTDGLYNHLDIMEINRILREEKDMQEACDTLIQLALYGGSNDNISCVLAQNTEVWA